jgi:hypothetical protein
LEGDIQLTPKIDPRLLNKTPSFKSRKSVESLTTEQKGEIAGKVFRVNAKVMMEIIEREFNNLGLPPGGPSEI